MCVNVHTMAGHLRETGAEVEALQGRKEGERKRIFLLIDHKGVHHANGHFREQNK
jgi:hypothetical protein